MLSSWGHLQWHQMSVKLSEIPVNLDCLFNSSFTLTTKKTPKAALISLCEGNGRWPWDSLHKGPVMWKAFPWRDVIMTIGLISVSSGPPPPLYEPLPFDHVRDLACRSGQWNTNQGSFWDNFYQLFPDLYATLHDDVIKWKHFPRYWPFVRGIHRSAVNSPHKGQWRGTLMFFLSAPEYTVE